MLHNAAVYLNYVMNQTEIVDLFCINKEEPEIQCNGTCHLKKQMAPTENNAQPSPPEVRFELLHMVMPESDELVVHVQFRDGKNYRIANTLFPEDADLKRQTPPPKRA